MLGHRLSHEITSCWHGTVFSGSRCCDKQDTFATGLFDVGGKKQPLATWMSCYYHRQHLLPETTHTHTSQGFEECLSDTTLRSESSTRLEEQQQPFAFQHARNKELLVWRTKKQHPIVSQWSDYKRQMSSTLTNSLLRQSLFRTCFSPWRKFFGVMTQSRYKTKYERHT